MFSKYSVLGAINISTSLFTDKQNYISCPTDCGNVLASSKISLQQKKELFDI